MTTSNIANALVNVTAPTQGPIFAQDINLTVNTLSTLNKYEQLFSICDQILENSSKSHIFISLYLLL